MRPIAYQKLTVFGLLALSTVGLLSQEPAPPASLNRSFKVQGFSFRYPDDWQSEMLAMAVMFAPKGGVRATTSGAPDLVCGFLVEIYTRSKSMWSVNPILQSKWIPRKKFVFRDAIKNIQKAELKLNPGIQYTNGTEREFKIGSKQALQVEWENENGRFGPEKGLMVFVEHDAGIVRWALVAPKNEFKQYRPVFNQIISSIAPEG